MNHATNKNECREGMYGSFYLGECEYAIPANRIEQVVESLPRCIDVPQSPEFVRGAFNLRGTVITVIDLETLFGLPKSENTDAQCVVVLEFNGQCIGLLFETTGEVFRGTSEGFSEFDAESRCELVCGIFKRSNGERLVQLLDVASLFKIPNVPRDASRRQTKLKTSKRLEHSSKTQYMTFLLEETKCALPISSVQEVFELKSLEKNSFEGQSCLGLTELRGGTLPILDFSAILGSRPALSGNAALEDYSIIVMRCESELFGLLVDSIAGIISAYEDDIVPFPSRDLIQTDMYLGCVVKEGLADVVVFDHEAILMQEEIKEITRVHGKVAMSPLRLLGKCKESTAIEQKETYLTFTAGSRYAVKINEIQEIIDSPNQMLEPPGLACGFSGIVNLRGQNIVAIVDLRNSSNESADVGPDAGQVLIFDAQGGKAGLVVDSVDSIVSVLASERIRFPDDNSLQQDPQSKFVEWINLTEDASQNASVTVVEMQSLLEDNTHASLHC